MTLRRPTPLRAAPAAEDRLRPATVTLPVATPSPTVVTAALTIVAVVLVPVAWGTVLWSAPGGDTDFNRRVTVQLFDLALVIAACPTIAALAAQPHVVADHCRRWTARRSTLLSAIVVLLGCGAVAFVSHPSPRGVELGARLSLGALAMGGAFSAPAPWVERLRIAIVATACAQALLAIAQSANGRPLGLGRLEFDGPLYPFGSSFAGRGGLTHPYHLAFLLEVGIVAALVSLRRTPRPLPWLVAMATCAAGLGVTYSRAAAVGVGAAVIALMWPHRANAAESRRLWKLAAAAMVAGAAATGLTMGDGWYGRTSGSTNVASADSGRVERAREAIELLRDEPVTGVGPGRYVVALGERGDAAPLPAHNVVLHVGAEAGVLAGVAIAFLGLLLARRYLVASRESAAAFVLVVPYFVFDAYPYVFPIGLFLTAIWLGLLEKART